MVENREKSTKYGRTVKVNYIELLFPDVIVFHRDRDIKRIKYNLKSLFFYIFFLLTATIVTLHIAAPDYWLTKVIRQQFVDGQIETDRGATVDFSTAKNAEEFWKFLDMNLFQSYYWTYWYMDEDIGKYDREEIANNILGVPRLRQLRVTNATCKVRFHNLFEICFHTYSKYNEYKRKFGPSNDTAWIYRSRKELNGSTYTGRIATYGGGGFYQDMSQFKEATKLIIENLKSQSWIDRQTRVIFLDYTIYNGNVNYFCILKLIFENPPTGNMITKLQIYTLKLMPYVSEYDYFVLACAAIFLFFLIYYAIQAIVMMKYFKPRIFMKFWFFVELVIITIGLFNTMTQIYIYTLMQNLIARLHDSPNQYVDFFYAGYWQEKLNMLYAVLIMTIWFKLFKYMALNVYLNQLAKIISLCICDIIGFLFIFVFVFVAYGLLGHLLFGSSIKYYQTIAQSMFTLIQALMGIFHYDEMEKKHSIVAPVYFISYMFVVFFILLNLFIAIVCDTYEIIKSGPQDKNQGAFRMYLKKLLQTCCRGSARCVRKKKSEISKTQSDKLKGVKSAKEMKSKLSRDSKMRLWKETESTSSGGSGMREPKKQSSDESNVKKMMKMCKFDESEIDMVHKKYNIEKKPDIDEDTMKEFINELQNNNKMLESATAYIETKQGSSSRRTRKKLKSIKAHIKILEANITELENIIGSIRQQINNRKVIE